MLEGRIIALDHGGVRIGVAVTDALGITAQPRGVIRAESPEADAEAVRSLVAELRAMEVVVGMPLLADGTRGEQARIAEAFAESLRAVLDVPVYTLDERFTSKAVERGMRDAGVKTRKQKTIVDELAAQQLLLTWLARRDRQI